MNIWKRSSIVFGIVLALWLVAIPVLADDGGRTAIFGENYTLEPGKRLDNDLLVFGGQVHLQRDSVVEGNVIVSGGKAVLEGQVNGDVLVLGGSVELAGTAVIERDLVVLGQLQRDHDATVKGNVVEGWQAGQRLNELPKIFTAPRVGIKVPTLPALPEVPELPARPTSGRSGGGIFGDLVSLLAMVIVAALLTALLPDNLRRVTQTMEQYMAFSLGVGVLTIVVVVIGSVILAITCIGIPLVIVLGIGLVLAAMAAWVAAGKIIGQKVLQALHSKSRSPVTEALVGVVLLGIASKVPCVGWLFSFLALSWGLGAVVLTRLGTRPYPPLSPFAEPPVASPPTPPVPPAPPVPATPPSAPRRGDTRPLNEQALGDDRPPEY